ncbi:MAG: HAMP domain-containing protein [Eubacterium sp.]|nr:HAMP domain-containing protein [Eubacterium sp.]
MLMTIRTKITLWFSALMIVIFAIMFTLIFVINRYVLYTDVEANLKGVVENNRDEIEYTDDFEADEVEPGDHYLSYGEGYLEIDDDFVPERQGVYTVLKDDGGRIIYGTPPIDSPLTDRDRVQTQMVDGERYYVYCVQLEEEELKGLVLQGFVNENASETILGRMVELSLLVVPALVLVAIIGGYLLAGSFLRPIRQMTATAESINDGVDLSRRIELDRGRDDLHQLADSFNRMMDRLEQAFEGEKQFTSDISHELRTPVSTILAQAELTLERDRTGEEYREDLRLIQRQGQYMKKIVNEMLRYSRLERMDTLPEEEEVDLSWLVETVAEEQMLNSRNGITLSWQAEPGLTIRGNTEMLIRLLTNLISNAFRYGKEKGTILVSLYMKDETVCLSVKDDGIGMDKKETAQIFHRFYQADAVRSSHNHSLGLGLSMVAEIVRLHHARIEVRSGKEKGSEFLIFF